MTHAAEGLLLPLNLCRCTLRLCCCAKHNALGWLGSRCDAVILLAVRHSPVILTSCLQAYVSYHGLLCEACSEFCLYHAFVSTVSCRKMLCLMTHEQQPLHCLCIWQRSTVYVLLMLAHDGKMMIMQFGSSIIISRATTRLHKTGPPSSQSTLTSPLDCCNN